MVRVKDNDSAPFVMGLFGGLPKTATKPSSRFMSGITVPTNTAMAGNASYVQALAKRLSCERPNRRRRSYGESSSTTADNKALTARCSETKVRTYRPSLSDRLTQSLITAGLVNGITPMSIRQASDQPIRAFAFSKPDGDDAAKRKVENSSLSGENT